MFSNQSSITLGVNNLQPIVNMFDIFDEFKGKKVSTLDDVEIVATHTYINDDGSISYNSISNYEMVTIKLIDGSELSDNVEIYNIALINDDVILRCSIKSIIYNENR